MHGVLILPQDLLEALETVGGSETAKEVKITVKPVRSHSDRTWPIVMGFDRLWDLAQILYVTAL